MDKERIYYKVLTSYKVLILMLYLRDLHAIERKLWERESAPAVMRFQQRMRHRQGEDLL